jgi:hypothetical protein
MSDRHQGADFDPPGLSPDVRYLLAELRQTREADQRSYEAMHLENQQHMEALDRELKAVSAAVKTGFPDGDLDGHRRYHELLIAREEQRQVIRREVVTHLLKSSTWIAITGIVLMCLRQLKDFIRW